MQLTDRVYLVGSGWAGFGLTDAMDCHCYLIDGGRGEVALVDAGAGAGVGEMLDIIRGHGLRTEDIRYLFLTHVHADHAGGAAAMRAAIPGLTVATGRAVADFVRSGDEHGISLDMGKAGGYYPPEYRFEPCPVELELTDGQAVPLGELQIEVLDTPGHSAGHVSLVIQDGGRTYLLCGDALFFGGKILLQSIWDCDLQAQLDSIRKLSRLKVDVFLPSHGSFSLRDGQRHITAAMGYIERCLVPPSLF